MFAQLWMRTKKQHSLSQIIIGGNLSIIEIFPPPPLLRKVNNYCSRVHSWSTHNCKTSTSAVWGEWCQTSRKVAQLWLIQRKWRSHGVFASWRFVFSVEPWKDSGPRILGWVKDVKEKILSDLVWMNNGKVLYQYLSGIVPSLFSFFFTAGGDYVEVVGYKISQFSHGLLSSRCPYFAKRWIEGNGVELQGHWESIEFEGEMVKRRECLGNENKLYPLVWTFLGPVSHEVF